MKIQAFPTSLECRGTTLLNRFLGKIREEK